MKLIFTHREQVATDAYTNHFEKPAGFEYKPGQFLEVELPHESEDDRGQQRWFTMSSSPTEDDITITTRHVSEHPSTFKNAFFDLKPGGFLQAKGPLGKFVLPEDEYTPLVWVAGGIGVTPFKSQMQYMLDKEQNRNVILLHGNRNPADNVCRELIEAFGKANQNFTYVEILSENPPKDWQGETGFIDEAKIKKYVTDLSRPEYFVSGPEPMVEALEPKLLALGITAEHLHQDWFPGYTEQY